MPICGRCKLEDSFPMNRSQINIRKAELKDARIIAEAEKEIAKEPGFFCSSPSELSLKIVEESILSSQYIYLAAEKNDQIVAHAFLEILNIASLRHIAELNIAVHKGHQNQGIGTLLMQSLIKLAKEEGSIEKIELKVRASNVRAIALYTKMGFSKEGLLKKRVKNDNSYTDDVIMALHIKGDIPHQKNSRVGVYGLVKENGKILVVTQNSGIYEGLFDLPGGGIEFGETIEDALHREFIEETGMDFKSMKLIKNAVANVDRPSYSFHQIGLIYEVSGLFQTGQKGSLNYSWVSFDSLESANMSPLLTSTLFDIA